MIVRKRYTENQEVTRVTVTLQVIAAILTAAILTAVLSCPRSQDKGDVRAAEQEGPAGGEAEAGGVAGVEEEAEVESVGEAELESVGGDDQHHSIMTGQQLQPVKHYYCGSTYISSILCHAATLHTDDDVAPTHLPFVGPSGIHVPSSCQTPDQCFSGGFDDGLWQFLVDKTSLR